MSSVCWVSAQPTRKVEVMEKLAFGTQIHELSDDEQDIMNRCALSSNF